MPWSYLNILLRSTDFHFVVAQTKQQNFVGFLNRWIPSTKNNRCFFYFLCTAYDDSGPSPTCNNIGYYTCVCDCVCAGWDARARVVTIPVTYRFVYGCSSAMDRDQFRLWYENSVSCRVFQVSYDSADIYLNITSAKVFFTT